MNRLEKTLCEMINLFIHVQSYLGFALSHDVLSFASISFMKQSPIYLGLLYCFSPRTNQVTNGIWLYECKSLKWGQIVQIRKKLWSVIAIKAVTYYQISCATWNPFCHLVLS